MNARADDLGSGNLFTVHNWWHLALYHLERSRHDRVLEIYDREIHRPSSAGVPIEMLDAAAMLWRMLLDGVDVGDRFDVLADAWANAIDGAPSWYAFNDVHAVMAFLGEVGPASPLPGLTLAEISLPEPDATILAIIDDRTPDLVERGEERRCRPHDRVVAAARSSRLDQTIAYIHGTPRS
ncbi:MAG: hypothetical protein ACFCVK_18720 [Acidimicrobiales bacterium]